MRAGRGGGGERRRRGKGEGFEREEGEEEKKRAKGRIGSVEDETATKGNRLPRDAKTICAR